MDSIYRQVPINRTTTSGKSIFGNKQSQGCQQNWNKKCPQYLHSGLSNIHNLTSSQLEGENVMSGLQRHPWFTVIPLGHNVRPEQVKVQLNPQYRVLVIKAYPRTSRSSTMLRGTGNQQIKQMVSLPKNILMDQLQVKLTQSGDLVVFAPCKSTQKSHQQQFGFQNLISNEESLLNSPFFQQQRGGEFGRGSSQWVNIPIKDSIGSRSSTSRNIFRSKSPFQGTTTDTETDTTTTDTSSTSCSSTSCTSTTTSESESELEGRKMKKLFKKRSSRSTKQMKGSNLPVRKTEVQQFVRLLQKIFYPNIVVAKIVPLQDTFSTSTSTSKQQIQLVLDIKFVNWTPETDVKVRLHETQPNVLIVECQKMRQDNLTGTSAVKYVRREIFVPQWLNVQQMVYRVMEEGVLRIKLPCLTNINTINYPGNYSTNYDTTCYCHIPYLNKGHSTTGFGCEMNPLNLISKKCQRGGMKYLNPSRLQC